MYLNTSAAAMPLQLQLKVTPPTVPLLWHQKSICGRMRHPPFSPKPPPPFAIHHVSRFIPSLIPQWQHIIVPPVAGFNYSHDAKAQAVAAIASSITKNYCTANLQMHCLLVVWQFMCVACMINISAANCWCWSSLFSDGLEINREEWRVIICLVSHCFKECSIFHRKELGNHILWSF